MQASEFIQLLEHDTTLLDSKFDSFTIWPIIRLSILQHVVEAQNQLDSTYTGRTIRKNVIFKNIWRSVLINNPYYAKPNNVIVFHTTISNTKVNGKNINRIVDYFIDTLDEFPIIIEEPFQFQHLYSREKKVYSKLFFLLLQKAHQFNASKKRIREADKIVSDLLNNIAEKLNFRKREKEKLVTIKGSLTRLLLSFKATYVTYRTYLKNKNCKLLILEDGHYGGEKGILIKAAKDLGVTVIEPQHGFVNLNHPAYSFGSGVLQDSRINSYFPDFYLTYGKFWQDSIRIPNQAIAIGNPHLAESSMKFKESSEQKKILVVGSGVTVQETQDLLLKLYPLAAERGFKVYYRPHPQEKDSANSRYNLAFSMGILKDELDLYSSIEQSTLILGELTTVIFEALAFNKKVKIFDTAYTKAYLTDNIKYFDFFNLENLSKVFETDQADENAKEYYWQLNWKHEFYKFIKGLDINICLK